MERPAIPRLPAALQDRFDQAMAALGPFEPQPFLAIAVSGGPDSVALLLLAAQWTAERTGRLLALTVDHGLRAEAADEAATLQRWLGDAGIRHDILSWSGVKPAANVQAEARAMRYQLLAERCHAEGCLHLLTGHQADDVAETFLMRLARGSGLTGLAAMGPEAALGPVRLLRPLLAIPRQVLADAVPAAIPLVNDPSNVAIRYARGRMRQAAPALGNLGLSADRIVGAAVDLRRARGALEEGVAILHLQAVRLHPAAFALLDPQSLAQAPAEIGLRLVAELLAAIGGQDYPPRFERLERLYGELAGSVIGRGRTLAGCLVLPRREGVLICREVAACDPDLPVVPGEPTSLTWDGRFQIRPRRPPQPGLFWGALAGVPGTPRLRPAIALPSAVVRGLPALRDAAGLLAVPHLGWEREPGAAAGFDVQWRPRRIVSGIAASARYTVV